jgi:predicted nuclease of predicted toxin-antitoxin system
VKIRLYLDEDVDVALASALRQRGIDVLTTQEAGKRQQTDDAQLEYAVQAGRVFFTHNRGDFARLHGQRVQEDRPHAGVIVSDQLPLGILLRRLSRLCFSLTQEEMMGRLEFLGGWR